MKSYAIGAAFLVALSAPAFAQATVTTEQYYVVRDPSTKKCTVVNEKPTTTSTTTIVGDGTVYKTRTEAEAGMKKTTICTSD
jgi:hypothetical protein